MTHWRFSWENPRSILIEGSATFTIAMSKTTMNWTALKSASASHLRRSVAIIGVASFRLCRECLQPNRDDLSFTSIHFTTASLRAIMQPMARTYYHYCPVAHALGVVGERWAL